MSPPAELGWMRERQAVRVPSAEKPRNVPDAGGARAPGTPREGRDAGFRGRGRVGRPPARPPHGDSRPDRWQGTHTQTRPWASGPERGPSRASGPSGQGHGEQAACPALPAASTARPADPLSCPRTACLRWRLRVVVLPSWSPDVRGGGSSRPRAEPGLGASWPAASAAPGWWALPVPCAE